MPGLKYRGRPLIYFGAWTDHLSIYGMGYAPIERHRAELADFELQKGAIRFQPGHPLPAALVKTLVRERMADIDADLAQAAQRRRAASR